jgi:X-Pro dipeptidyl-peptidase (S15 family)
MRTGAAVILGIFVTAPSARAQSTTLDSKSIGVFTGAGTTQPGLTCSPASPQMGSTRCSGFLESDVDGTLLDVTVIVPDASGPHPLVAFVHGYGGSKNSSSSYDDAFLAHGFTVLRYSTRGFGESWGQVNLSRFDVEVADLRSLIGQVVDDQRLLVRADKVAVAGASYGGGHSWLAAETPTFKSPAGTTVSIATVVPIATWSDLLASLRPNGDFESSIDPPGFFKLSFLEGLFLSGIRTSSTRPYPNYPPYFFIWNAYGLATEPNNLPPIGSSMVEGLTQDRSIFWRPAFWNAIDSGSGIPIFIAQGFTDDLFPAPEALRMYQAILARQPAYPIAAYFGDVGHPRAANKPDEVQYALNLALAWLDYHLNGVGTPPSGVTAAITRPGAPFNPATDIVQVPDWGSLSTSFQEVDFPGARTITFDPANVSGLFVDPLAFTGCEELSPNPCAAPAPAFIPGDVALYTIPASRVAPNGGAKFLIAGEPVISVSATTDAPREQLDARLYVVSAGVRTLVTRGTITLDSGAPLMPIGSRNVTLRTYGNLYEVNSTDLMELELTNVDSPYLTPSRVPSVTRLSDVKLTVPLR